MVEATFLRRVRMKNKEIWKAFKIDSIFDMFTGASISQNKFNAGSIPRITATDTNNGIALFTERIEDRNFRSFQNFISVSFLGSIFYHNYEASLDMKIHGLKLKDKELNPNLAQFLIVCLKNSLPKASYGNQLSSKDLLTKNILLPVNEYGTPNWAFMENYVQIKSNQIKATYQFPKLHEITDYRELDEVRWGEFLISDYFDVNKEKGSESNMDSLAEGNLPLISARKFGNGLKGFVETEPRKVKSSNVITWNKDGDGGAGLAYYQEFKFAVDSHVFVLYAKFPANKYNQLFIVTLLSKYKAIFNHGRANSLSRYKAEKIMLPIKDGMPDFVFMEQYMKRMENRVIEKVEK